MARSRLPDSARVPIGLKVSEADASRIDQVLARPEFTGWTRAEWCREIIRTALRYYTGDPPTEDNGQDRPPAAQPATAQPEPPATPEASAPAPVESEPGPEPPAEPEPPAPPEPLAQAECLHPSDARDYETGTCAVCGAILWD